MELAAEMFTFLLCQFICVSWPMRCHVCPDMQILLWFVIPIKMKWMAIVYGVMVLYDMITYLRARTLGVWQCRSLPLF